MVPQIKINKLIFILLNFHSNQADTPVIISQIYYILYTSTLKLNQGLI